MFHLEDFEKSSFSDNLSIGRSARNIAILDFAGGSMGETEMPTIHFNRDRRRSSFTRPMRDPEEILEGLRSLKAAKRELGRTMSLSGDKRRESREYGYVASLFFLGLIIFAIEIVRSARQFRSSIRADCLPVCLSVWLSLSHTLVDLFLYSSSSSLSFSLLFFSHHH